MTAQIYTLDLSAYSAWYLDNVSPHGIRFDNPHVLLISDVRMDTESGEPFVYIKSADGWTQTYLPTRFLTPNPAALS